MSKKAAKEKKVLTPEMEGKQPEKDNASELLVEELLGKVAELEEKLKAAVTPPPQPIVQVVTGEREKQEPPGEMKPEEVEYLQERIPFRAFKDGNKYSEDISVQVNGKIWQIQRGIQVMIPRFVYLALEQSERQLAEAATREAQLVKEFEGKRGILT